MRVEVLENGDVVCGRGLNNNTLRMECMRVSKSTLRDYVDVYRDVLNENIILTE